VRKKNSVNLPPIRAVSVFVSTGSKPMWHVCVFTALFDPGRDPEPGYRWGAVEYWSVGFPYSSSRAKPPQFQVEMAHKLAKDFSLPYIEGITFGGQQGLSPIELLSGMGDENGS
jgi:hypothetical protein